MAWTGNDSLDRGAWSRRNHERRAHPQLGPRVIRSRRVRRDQVHRDRDHRPCHPGLPSLVHHPEVQLSARWTPARMGHLNKRVDREQTLLEELVWSVILIGGVVAYLV